MSDLIKQIRCPPNKSKYSIKVATKKWIPNFLDYSLTYNGLKKPKNKVKHKYTLGTNMFLPTGQTCSSQSTGGCIGKPKYIYHRTYPKGFTVGCKGTHIQNQLPGKTGLIGGLMEDISSMNITDNIRAFFNKGPYGSNKCINVKLPVGTNLLDNTKKRSEKTDETDTWWEEEKCVPKQPTYSKNYGGITYSFPYTESIMCREDFMPLITTPCTYEKNIIYILITCILILLFWQLLVS